MSPNATSQAGSVVVPNNRISNPDEKINLSDKNSSKSRAALEILSSARFNGKNGIRFALDLESNKEYNKNKNDEGEPNGEQGSQDTGVLEGRMLSTSGRSRNDIRK